MASASYLLEGSSLLQVPGLDLTCLLQIRPAAFQLLAPLHDVLGLGVPRGCEVSPGTQHPLHLSLVGSHLRPELLPQNRGRAAASGHSLATGGPEQSRECGSRAQDDLQAEKGWRQRLGNQDSLSHGGGHLGSGKGCQGSWEETGTITSCLWRRRWAPSGYLEELGLGVGMCSATHVSSASLRWWKWYSSTEACSCHRRVARCPCRALNLGGQRRQKGWEQVRSSAQRFPHPSQGPTKEEAGTREHHLKTGRQLERPRARTPTWMTSPASDCEVLGMPGWGL